MALMGYRFLRTGGIEVLRMMEAAPDPHPATGEGGMHHHHEH